MDRDALVALVVEEVRRALAQRATPVRLLVAVTGNPADPDALAAELAEVGSSGRFRSTLLLSQTAARGLDRRRLEQALAAEAAVAEGEGAPRATALAFGADAVLVPWLSVNTAAKLAVGVCDNLVTSVLMLALLRGIPTVACAEEADPDGPCLGAWARPAPGLAALLRSHLAALASYGVTLAGSRGLAGALLAAVDGAPAAGAAARPVPANATVPAGAVARPALLPAGPGASPGRRPVVTRADVEAALAAGDPGRLPADGVWTPLAREAMPPQWLNWLAR